MDPIWYGVNTSRDFFIKINELPHVSARIESINHLDRKISILIFEKEILKNSLEKERQN
jgi:hypothetical protein